MSSPGHGEPTDAERSPPQAEQAAEAAAVRAAIRAVRGGDREAFGRLLELYQRRLFGLALVMVRDPEGAEELAQDAFVRAYTRLDLYDEQRPFYPWLAAIAVRLAQNWLRRYHRTNVREGTPIDPERDGAPSPDPLESFLADESRRRLWHTVAGLPSGERTAVTLFYRQGLKVSEVAQALGVTSGTVKTLLFRARQKLRERLPVPTDSPQSPEEPQ